MPRWRELPSSVMALAGGKPAPVLCQARVRVLGFARHTRAGERRASRHRQSGGNRMLGSNMSRLTRRHVLKTGGAVTFAGYAVGVDKVFAQVIKTDTQGIVAGDVQVKIGEYAMPIYEAHPATGSGAPILLVISEIWGVHEWIKDVTRRFAKEGCYAVAPELFQREGGVGHIPNIQDMLKRHNRDVEIVIYPGAGHGFFADYRPSYNEAAATDAWKRCLAFLAKRLKA